MYDLAIFIEEMLGIANDAIIKSGAHGHEDVAMLHGHVGFIGAMHAQHPDKLLVGGRIPAQSHQCICAGKAQHSYQIGEPFRRIAQYDAAPGVDHRPLGFQYQLYRFFDLSRMPPA